jgi:excinuclease UvrABC helicase subunit UvrB
LFSFCNVAEGGLIRSCTSRREERRQRDEVSIMAIYPARHHVTLQAQVETACIGIKTELETNARELL